MIKQIKITMRYYFTSTTMAIVRKSDNNKRLQRCGEIGSLWRPLPLGIGYCRNDCVSLPRLGPRTCCGLHLALSWVFCSEESQLTNCQVVRTLSEPSRRSPPWWDLDSSLPTRCNLEADPVAPAEPQMTVALAANLTATLWETLSSDHPARPLLGPWPRETVCNSKRSLFF